MTTAWVDWAERQDFGMNGGSFVGGPPKLVLHTTETRGWPGYQGGKIAPQLTALPLPMEKRLAWRQHSPLTMAARSLRNVTGGIQTNRDSVEQIELIGTCDPAYAAKYPDAYKWYDADDWTLEQLAEKIKWLSSDCGFSLVAPSLWPSYPQSYGNGAGQRMSMAEWDNFNGICAHMHVPENDHGDTGSLNITRLLELCGGVVAQPAPIQVTPAPVKTTRPAPGPGYGFPLPSGYYFGPKSGGNRSVSGYYNRSFSGHTDNWWLKEYGVQMQRRGWNLNKWLPSGNDGKYGPEYAGLTLAFQKDQGLGRDGLLGEETWMRAFHGQVS